MQRVHSQSKRAFPQVFLSNELISCFYSHQWGQQFTRSCASLTQKVLVDIRPHEMHLCYGMRIHEWYTWIYVFNERNYASSGVLVNFHGVSKQGTDTISSNTFSLKTSNGVNQPRRAVVLLPMFTTVCNTATELHFKQQWLQLKYVVCVWSRWWVISLSELFQTCKI